jgi:hypothetical protein
MEKQIKRRDKIVFIKRLSCGRKRAAKVTGLKQKNREKVGFCPGMYAMFVNLNNGSKLFYLAAPPRGALTGPWTKRLL